MTHVASVLTRAYGEPVETRRLRDWVRKGLLPPLQQQGMGRGKGKIYYWLQRTIIQQAGTVLELLKWRGRADLVPLQLWLLGFDIPIDRIRETLLTVLQNSIQAWTQGGDLEETDDLADALSGLAVKASTLRANAPSAMRRLSKATRENLAEVIFNLGFNPAFTLDNALLDELLQALQSSDQRQVEPSAPSQIEHKMWQQAIALIHVHFNRVHHRKVIARAPDALFGAVQEDFRSLLCALQEMMVMAVGNRSLGSSQYNIVGNLGLMIVPVLLSLREAEYAPWVDRGREILCTLSQPDILEAIHHHDFAVAQRLIDARDSRHQEMQ